MLNKSHSLQDMMQRLLPVLEQLLDKCQAVASMLHEDESNLLQLIAHKYTPDTAILLQSESPCWTLLLRLLSMRTSVCPGQPSPIMTGLGQVSTEKWNLSIRHCF